MIGDIVYSRNLSNNYRLECVISGTSASVDPTYISPAAGQYVQDGTCTWLITDIRDQSMYGTIQLMYTVLPGWVKANGAVVNRVDYPRLVEFATTNNLFDDNNEGLYGTGDGINTFKLPNLIGRFFESSNTSGKLISAGLPNITGELQSIYTSVGYMSEDYTNYNTNVCSGCLKHNFIAEDVNNYTIGISKFNGRTFLSGINIDVSKSNNIYNNSTTVQPASIQLIPCIKY